MTDARFPERWLTDRRLLRLSDRHFRVFVSTLAWSVSNRTDGVIEHDDLPLVPVQDASPMDAAALVAAGLWTDESRGWRVVDFDSSQSSRHELEILENARRREREKKARQRARRAAEDADVPGDRPGDVSPVQHRKDRTGRTGSTTGPRTEPGSPGAEASTWPPVRALGGAQ